MSFTETLRKENNNMYEQIFNHPFVDGIGKGAVPKAAIKHYVEADFEYLNAFMRIYGLAIAKSTNREDIAQFFEMIKFILEDETHPHRNFCDYIGIPYEELQGAALPPTADHYVKHMMYHAQTGSMGEILAALLPCPWTYLEIGEVLIDKYHPEKTHPFYDWIQFYGNTDAMAITHVLRDQLDNIAATASIEEQNRMRDAFRKSCELELGFWEMSYTCERWPSEIVVEKQ